MARRPTQRRLYEALLKRFEKDVAEAFMTAISQARASVNMRDLARAIDAGDFARALQMLQLDQARLFVLTEAVRQAYIAGGQSVAQVLPGAVGIFAFDGSQPRAAAWISQHGGDLVQGIAADTQDMLQAVLRDGVDTGRSGAAVARDITGKAHPATGRREGGFLGLTTQQTDAAIRARAQLTALDASYFDRKLRDRRFDPMVRKAIASGTPLSAADIETITMRYRDRMAGYRGRMIARNEAHTALSMGQREGFQQIIDAGRVQGVLKRWQWNDAGQDAREDHRAMSSMPAIPFDRPFTMGDGTQMQGPHDPAGGAKHSIGCRCIAVYRVIVPER